MKRRRFHWLQCEEGLAHGHAAAPETIARRRLTAHVLKLALALLGLVLFASTSTDLEAQPLSKRARIGVLLTSTEAGVRDLLEGLRHGLVEQGLTEGDRVLLEFRYAGGQVERLNSLATELAGSVDLILAGGDAGAQAAKRATDKLPIVAVTCDALAAQLVTNLARPGGNLTGVTCINSELSAKRVELIKEAIPSLSQLGALLNPDDRRMIAEFKEAQRAATATSIAIHPLVVNKLEHLEAAFVKASSFGAVVVIYDVLTYAHRAKVAQIASSNRVATIFNFRQFVEVGGLMSFGPNLRDMYRQAARHIRKILEGELPGDIPMEQPTRFELVINLKTAKTLGLIIPPSLLARADEVIE